MTEPREIGLHFSDVRLAAFLDGRLTPTEHDQALAHFATCVSCRREMTAARKLLVEPATRRRGWHLPITTLIAAALAFVAVPRLMRVDPSPSRESIERARPDVAPVVQILSPAHRSAVNAGDVVFLWRAVGVDATYRVTLQDSTGGVLWETTVGDTSATPPRSVAFVANQDYYWSVDAQLADGRTAKAGVHQFTAR